jgi:hypothetical protein
MIMNAPTITASAHTHVGTAPLGYHEEEWVQHTVHYHGFRSLTSEQDEYEGSPKFTLLGNQWRLSIYPGGDDDAAEGMVSTFLYNMSEKFIKIDYGFSVNDGNNGKQVAYKQSATPEQFGPVGTDTCARGIPNFAKRSTLFNSLVNGTLVIKVCMKMAKPTKSVPPPFIPENPFAKNIQRMITDENFGDISFVIGGNQKNNNAEQISKTVPIKFHAHRDILRECSAGIFADICRSNVASMSTPIEITDVSPDVFRHLLQSAYGISISDEDMKSQTKELIDAANRCRGPRQPTLGTAMVEYHGHGLVKGNENLCSYLRSTYLRHPPTIRYLL